MKLYINVWKLKENVWKCINMYENLRTCMKSIKHVCKTRHVSKCFKILDHSDFSQLSELFGSISETLNQNWSR